MTFTVPSSKDFRAALAKAKTEFADVVKNKVNPHFKNSYADYGTILEAIEPALAANGFVLAHAVETTAELSTLTTVLFHTEFDGVLASSFPLPDGSPQQVAGAITYGRRYNVTALLDIVADEDADGNNAGTAPSGRTSSRASANKGERSSRRGVS